MASNFKILIHKNSDSLHLKLAGDFDAASAHELLNALEKNANDVDRVFIHTNCLEQVHSLGTRTFHARLGDVESHSYQILFTGEKANTLALASTRY